MREGDREEHKKNLELELEIKRQFEIRRASIQNLIKENEEFVKISKVRAAASTTKKVNGLLLSVSILFSIIMGKELIIIYSYFELLRIVY
jgi:hypothetical protein